MEKSHAAHLRSLIGDQDALAAYLAAHPIAGAGPENDPLYPTIPTDDAALDALTDDEVAELIETATSRVRDVASGTVDVGDRNAGDVVAETRAAVEGIEKLKAIKTAREVAIAEIENELAELAGRVAPEAAADEPETDDDDEPGDEPVDEPEAAEELEPVAAAAAKHAAARRRLPARPKKHEPKIEAGLQPTITASVDGPKGGAGAKLDNLLDVAALMVNRRERMGFSRDGDRMPIATIRRPLAEDRTLGAGDNERTLIVNQQRIDNVIAPKAIAAAGGICVMPTPRYDVETFGVTDEPVRSSIPTFNADRGGIAWYPPVSFAEVSSAIGVITNTEALSGGSNALKTCQAITCPPTQTAVVDSRYRCIEIGNLEARTFPERVEAFVKNVMVAQAQLAEVDALAEIDAATIAISSALTYGATNDILGVLQIQRASIASTFRLDPAAPMRAILPAWLPDMLVQDQFRQGLDPDRYTFQRARIVSLIESMGFNVTWTLDSQLITQAGAGVTVAWPSTVVARIFPEGAYLRLDAGTLDLGLVRDSTLNARNVYQLFAETFEKIAFVGFAGMSRKLTITTKPGVASGNSTGNATVPTNTF